MSPKTAKKRKMIILNTITINPIMKMKKINFSFFRLLFAGLVVVAAFNSNAQTLSRTDDTLKTKDVVIVKEFEPVISEAFKINDNPRIVDTLKPQTGELSYTTLKKQIDTEFEVLPIRAAVMKGEPLEKLYKAYARGGYGLYNTALGELYINNLRSRTKNYGFRANHLSSTGNIKNVGYSGYSNTSAELYGKQIFYNKILSGAGSYSYDRYHFYGFDTRVDTIGLPTDFYADTLAKNAIQQNFQKMAGEVRFKSYFRDSNLVNFDLYARGYNVKDAFNANETNVKFTGALDRFYDENQIFLNFGADYNQYQNSLGTFNNTLINLEPAFATGGEKWRVKLGLRTFVNADTITTFKAYPIAFASYNLVGNYMVPYVGYEGNLSRNNFDQLRQTNPFLQNDQAVAVSNNKYKVYGGVRGQFSSNSSFNLKASQELIENYALFVNDYSNLVANRFLVVYDTAEVTTLTAEFSYQQKEKLNIYGRGDYFIFNMQREARAWHTPDFRGTLGATYDLQDKIMLKAEFSYISKQYAKSYNPADGEAVGYGAYAKELKGLVDINLGAEYRYNKNISGWISLQNLASMNYERWNLYPTQGFLGMLGFTYSFISR